MKKLVIIGAGGNGRVVADIALKMAIYENIYFLDDGKEKESLGIPIIGKTSDIKEYILEADFFVSIGNSNVRQKFIEQIESLGGKIATLIHPSAILGKCVEIDVGSAIMAGAVINPCVKIGKGVIVNTCSSIDHDSIIENFCHISVGSHIAGCVHIGEHTWIGIGAAISNNLTIIKNCIIGAGAVVVKNIDKVGVYIGVPAKFKE